MEMNNTRSQINRATQGRSKKRWWDFPAVIVLLIALYTVAARLDATRWTNDLSIITTIVVLGVIAGLGLGQSRFSRGVVLLLTLLYGTYVIGWQIGLSTDFDLSWLQRFLILVNRSTMIIDQLADQAKVSDSLLFILLMAVLFWILGVSAGYSLTRLANGWMAIIPAGLALFIIHAYDPLVARKAAYLAVFLFFSLVFLARVYFLHKRTNWIENKTIVSPHLGLDFIWFSLAVVSIILVFSWFAPTLARTVPAAVTASQPIRQAWSELRARWENAFAPLRSTINVYTDFYGDNISLGLGNPLTDTPILFVKIPETTPIGVRYYWRAMSYDTYQDGQWINTRFQSKTFNPDDAPLNISKEDGRWTNTFEFTPTTFAAAIYSPGEPYWASVEAQAQIASNPDGTVEVAGFRVKPSLKPNQSYNVQSSLSTPTEKQLRESGTEYPEWITDRYSSLPDTITTRTRDLAQEIAGEFDNPYDKTIAITDYLRKNITYQESIPKIPENQEPIDWFLFDQKEGFCNYYSTAEIVLLRSLGIPARWAIGYARGELQEDGRFIVREKDAHSWVEVYFAGYGWVEFEPTVSQPNIARLSGESNNDTADAFSLERELDELRRQQLEDRISLGGDTGNLQNQSGQPAILQYFLIAGTLLILTGLGLLVWLNRNRLSFPVLPILVESTMIKLGIQPPKAIQLWSKRSTLSPVSKAYLEVNRALSWLGQPAVLTQTPAERVEKLGRIVPPATEASNRLLNEYQVAVFSKKEADEEIARQAGREIRWKALKVSFRIFFKKFRRKSADERMKDRMRHHQL